VQKGVYLFGGQQAVGALRPERPLKGLTFGRFKS